MQEMSVQLLMVGLVTITQLTPSVTVIPGIFLFVYKMHPRDY
jgi:hypothetical protein